MVKIVFPTLDDKGESLGQHFGRVPYYAWFELDDGKVVDKGVAPNDSEHFGGVGLPPERIGRLNPDVMIVLGMGSKAISMFQDMKVAVLQAKGATTAENIDFFVKGELQELTEGCLHEH
ncbi:MAG TPA: NifB/NifX family molybdenum-iron cluster-binding protein [Patescibacteria group bacterium]|nr:NifB/NifX family molybdenum-iron cluster-binding protein [Patescibacteria group bacterium]